MPRPVGDIDHIVARSANGDDDPSNWTATCASCNAMKGTWPLVLWLALRQALVSVAHRIDGGRNGGGADRRVVVVGTRANDWYVTLTVGTPNGNPRHRRTARLDVDQARSAAAAGDALAYARARCC